jgi:hypothetical protein
LTFVRGEADEETRKVTLLEGELLNVHQAPKMVEVKLRGLSNRAADVNRLQEDAKMQCEALV